MKLLKSEQYKIVLEYFRLNENLNSFPALISDLEKLDLDGQKDALAKLRKFIYKKIKEINTKKKKNQEEVLYDKNKDHIEKIKEILKNSPLKNIDKDFQLKKSDNFLITRKYENKFTGRSQKVIDSLIEEHDKIDLDTVHFRYNYNRYELNLNIEIQQYYVCKENTVFYLRISMSDYDNNGIEIPELKKIKKRMIQKGLKLISLEELNLYLKNFKKEFENVEMYVDMKKYNL